jgi:uncharacterized protein
MRAMIRAHVEASSGHATRIAGYFTAATQYLNAHAPLVIAIGGLPGTGKSTLARAIAPVLGAAPGALILRSDEIRKRQHGVEPEQRLPQSAYTEAKSAAVFDEIARGVTTAANAGHAAIADATFIDPAQRSLIEAAAQRSNVPFVGIWLSAPLPVLEQRIAARAGDASDATVEVLRNAARPNPGAGAWHAVDASEQGSALSEVLTLANCERPSHIAF